MWDDGIIDPAKTRDVLGLAISASLRHYRMTIRRLVEHWVGLSMLTIRHEPKAVRIRKRRDGPVFSPCHPVAHAQTLLFHSAIWTLTC